MGGEPGLGKVTATVASASPYTGKSALSRNPRGANADAKRRSRAGGKGSAPPTAHSHDRSSSLASRARSASLTQSPYADGGAAEMVPRTRDMVASQHSGSARKVPGEIMCAGKSL